MKDGYNALDTNNRLIRNFWDISHTMRRISEGKGSQKRILMLLREMPGMTQRELTERLGIQPGSASEVVGKLESAGLIQRVPSETDRRTTDIHLTEAGKAAAEEAYVQREARHEKMFSCLSGAEKQTLLDILEKLNASWNQQYQHDGQAASASGRGRGHRGCK